MADTPTNTPAQPDSPELAALKNRTAILEQELAQAQARQKLISTLLPSSDVKPLEGTVKIDGDHPVESQILAYHGLNRVAKKIAEVVVGKNPTRILIHSDADINSLMSFQSFVEQMSLIRDDLGRIKAEAESAHKDAEQTLKGVPEAAALPAALAPVVVGAALRSAIDLLSLFRVDVSVKFKDIAINDLALVAAVSGSLVAKGVTVFNPSLMPPNLFARDSQVRANLRELDKLFDDLDQTRRAVELLQEKVKAETAELSDKLASAATASPPPDTRPLKQAIAVRQRVSDRLAVHTGRLNATATAFNTFREALLKTDDSSGLNALARLLRAEKLAAAAGDDSHLLVLKVAAAGGGVKTKQSRFSSGKLTYSGGAIVEFLLFAPDGSTTAAGTLPAYTGFIEVNEREEDSKDLSPFTEL